MNIETDESNSIYLYQMQQIVQENLIQKGVEKLSVTGTLELKSYFKKEKDNTKRILKSERESGRSEKAAKRIAMATVNKTRKEKCEAKDL